MKIVSWNINGIRATKSGLKALLDSLDAEIICLQETKVTRDLLDEPTAIVDGYSSYFSFSRGRSGYSGVVTYCKNCVTPFAAEEGLTGLLTNHSKAVGCYGNTEEFSNEELLSLDSEGRAVITQHKICSSDQREQVLTVINVYCPRADPEKPERKVFKLRFYRLLQARAEDILESGSHVIIVGDINTSHRPIDHCDPEGLESFDDHPGRKWLNEFLYQLKGEGGSSESLEGHAPGSGGAALERQRGGLFVDTFRLFHPAQRDAFTCWSTATGARQTNYGTRIDYIFAGRVLADEEFEDSFLMPEVEGSDHCPVKAVLKCCCLAASRCPPFCTKYLPEFAGRQQKLLQFLVKVDKSKVCASDEESLPSSQETSEITENLAPSGKTKLGWKRGRTELGEKNAKKTKVEAGQGTLLSFFKPNCATTTAVSQSEEAKLGGASLKTEDLGTPPVQGSEAEIAREVGKKPQSAFWKTVLKGPPPPPICKGHNEPCVLRTVKKAGPNYGRQFYVCARPEGHASNPAARCNFFLWVGKSR
ncbi:DNA-(apurinic or apyrimidinic site) lyase 2 [Latimeria chalumnae]|uniref:DNA-(apurinic or apyrimidinic site) lyase 2 n=1 Tax=Latimeria chalumnae TaxID=7897 RepID=UPI0006D8F65B|nr:PREDICTED: DNA-(apurinic or apyrimidinic site) lyase 2 [Latimeria chalumnae]|eukprot:XP_014352550.1 PREDICTED: DNA-(apurinic or apyrimidinic site) lyase 2 [Latimeria chalumnae]